MSCIRAMLASSIMGICFTLVSWTPHFRQKGSSVKCVHRNIYPRMLVYNWPVGSTSYSPGFILGLPEWGACGLYIPRINPGLYEVGLSAQLYSIMYEFNGRAYLLPLGVGHQTKTMMCQSHFHKSHDLFPPISYVLALRGLEARAPSYGYDYICIHVYFQTLHTAMS